MKILKILTSFPVRGRMRFFKRLRLSLMRARLLFSIRGFIVWKEHREFSCKTSVKSIDATKCSHVAYLSELNGLFSFGNTNPLRKRRKSFIGHIRRHFQFDRFATWVLEAEDDTSGSNGSNRPYISRSVASVSVRHGYAPKPKQNIRIGLV